MKLYVHFDEEPVLTKIYRPVNDGDTEVATLVADFLTAYNAKNGSKRCLKACDIVVENSRGKVIEVDRKVRRVFTDTDDVFIRPNEPTTGIVAHTRSVPLAAKNEHSSQNMTEHESLPAPESDMMDPNGPVVRGLVARGKELEASKKLRAAMNCYQQVSMLCT